MTKMDGDSRGGAALSTKKVTGKPIKFIGTGEKQDALQVFHPERMASRILGMGDMLSLIEEAEKTFDDKQAAKMEEKLKKNQFTLEDFLEQMGQVKKMGGISKILDMLPGMNKSQMQGVNIEAVSYTHLTEQDLLKIQKEMKKIIQANYPIERFELPRKEAIEFEKKSGEDYNCLLYTSKPFESVLSSVEETLDQLYGNPSSLHDKGFESEQLLKRCV